MKLLLLLARPTTIKAILPKHTEMLEHPATGLEVPMDIAQLLQCLKVSGSAKALNKTFDLCGNVLGISVRPPKTVEHNGRRREVSEAEFVDAKGGNVASSVWETCYSNASVSDPRRWGLGRRLQRHSC